MYIDLFWAHGLTRILFVKSFQFRLYLFSIGFASGSKIFEFDGIIDDLYMKYEESPIVTNAYAVNATIANEFFTVSYVFNFVGSFYFLNNVAYSV